MGLGSSRTDIETDEGCCFYCCLTVDSTEDPVDPDPIQQPVLPTQVCTILLGGTVSDPSTSSNPVR
jgi:hypothetical protein